MGDGTRARKADGATMIVRSRAVASRRIWLIAGSITAVAQIMLAVFSVRSAIVFSQLANTDRMVGEQPQRRILLWLWLWV